MAIGNWDGLETAAHLKAGEVSPVEAIDAAIERCQQVDPEINAFVWTCFEKAREEAARCDVNAGALSGVPYAIKDLGGLAAGEPTSLGNRFLKQKPIVSPIDDNVIARLRSSGLVSIGRTNVPEFAGGNCPGASENEVFGNTRNPWKPAHTPMGSSGGSAAAVASGIVPIAHGNDGGGSIRIPANANGLVGFKVSRGRISLGPASGHMAEGTATEGVVTRTVRDTAACLDALAGFEPGDPYSCFAFETPLLKAIETKGKRLKIGFCRVNEVGPLHQDTADVVSRVADKLANLGHGVTESHPERFFDKAILDSWSLIFATVVGNIFGAVKRRYGYELEEKDVERGTWVDYTRYKDSSLQEYLATVARINSFSRDIARWWHGEDGFDVLVTPTTARPAPALGDLVSNPDDRKGYWHHTFTYTAQFNFSGQPAVSLPLGESNEGLPIGVQLVGRYGDEQTLIQLAAELEDEIPWKDRKPAIFAE
jgi:amidase